MDELLYETKYLGSSVKVYKNRIEWKMLLQKKSVPISQIAAVELGMPLHAKVTIETTGGKKYGIPVMPGKKQPLQDAIFKAQSGDRAK